MLVAIIKKPKIITVGAPMAHQQTINKKSYASIITSWTLPFFVLL